MLHSIVFLLAGLVSIVLAYRVYPFNRPEFDVLDSVFGKNRTGTKVGGVFMIAYAIFNAFWPA